MVSLKVECRNIFCQMEDSNDIAELSSWGTLPGWQLPDGSFPAQHCAIRSNCPSANVSQLRGDSDGTCNMEATWWVIHVKFSFL